MCSLVCELQIVDNSFCVYVCTKRSESCGVIQISGSLVLFKDLYQTEALNLLQTIFLLGNDGCSGLRKLRTLSTILAGIAG